MRQGKTDTGYLDAVWTVPTSLADGSYDIAVQVSCHASVTRSELGEDAFTSPPVSGIVDRTPPILFGKGVVPANNFYFPGDEISATFNEEIDCTRPYNFVATMKIPRTKSAPATTLTGAMLSTYCAQNKISIEFLATSGIPVRSFRVIAQTHSSKRCIAGVQKKQSSKRN